MYIVIKSFVMTSLQQVYGVRLLPRQPQPPLHPGPQRRPPHRPPRQGPPQRRGPDSVTGPRPQAGQPAPRSRRAPGEARSLSGQDPIRTRGPGWRRSNG